jgi:hypothetical protein
MEKLNFNRVLAQLAALPFRLKLWLAWLMFATLAVPLALLSQPFFLALMVCQAANIVFGGWLMLRYGLVKLLSLAHILFWTPMIGKFVFYYDTLAGFELFVAYSVILTVFVSLVVDFRDFLDWRRGDREPIV